MTDLICERIRLWEARENPYVIHEFKNSLFVVGDHQFYRGYALLLLKRHVRELHELEDDEYLELAAELRQAAGAVQRCFKPWRLNYQCLGNKDEHVHWHILPRYETDKYHKTLPMTDYMRGEVNLQDYVISAATARRIAAEVRAYV